MKICSNNCNLSVTNLILKERKMEFTGYDYRAMILYDFKVKLDQEEYIDRLQLAYREQALICDSHRISFSEVRVLLRP